MTTHEFQVVATNSTVTSLSSGETSESIFPSSLVSAAGVGAGAATSLFLPYASCEAFKQNKSYGGESQLTQFQSDFFDRTEYCDSSAEHSSDSHYCTDTCTCHCGSLQSRVCRISRRW